MLSYLHAFHAGNHADILKHITLLYTLDYFNKKQKPYTVFDTHSGSALYSLSDEKSIKTGEASRGIEKLLSCSEKELPPELLRYVQFVKSCLKEKKCYPGSPFIESECVFNGSNLFFTELHKTEFALLSKNIFQKSSINIQIINEDGFSFLKKHTPPAVKRGFILCDPSYEEKSDYLNTAQTLNLVHKKWSGATILLWYPLIQNRIEEIDSMKTQILSTVKNKNANAEVLDARFLIDTEDSHIEKTLAESIGSEKPRLYGSGMFVVNPCWNLDIHLKAILPFFADLLGKEKNGSWAVEMF